MLINGTDVVHALTTPPQHSTRRHVGPHTIRSLARCSPRQLAALLRPLRLRCRPRRPSRARSLRMHSPVVARANCAPSLRRYACGAGSGAIIRRTMCPARPGPARLAPDSRPLPHDPSRSCQRHARESGRPFTYHRRPLAPIAPMTMELPSLHVIRPTFIWPAPPNCAAFVDWAQIRYWNPRAVLPAQLPARVVDQWAPRLIDARCALASWRPKHMCNDCTRAPQLASGAAHLRVIAIIQLCAPDASAVHL